MSEKDEQEVNSSVTPPGSSESFDDFKGRIIDAMTGIAADNEGHNTAIITHSKPIGVLNGWEHAGYPEDGNIHMSTYEEARDKKPGNHQEVEVPEHVNPFLSAVNQAGKYLHKMFLEPMYENKEADPLYWTNKWNQNQGETMRNQITDTAKLAVENPSEFVSQFVGPGHLGTPMIGMFGGASWGRLSPVRKMNYEAAKSMVGKHEPEQIFKETGWYQDADGHWKTPINTDTAKLKLSSFDMDMLGLMSLRGNKPTLKDIYYNKDLYDMYPNAKDIPIKIETNPDYSGSYNQRTNVLKIKNKQSYTDTMEIIHHELQHFIQGQEGFPTGGNMSNFQYDVQGYTPKDKYKRLFGEVEARNAEKWSAISDKRKQQYQEEGFSPRDSANMDIPETLRLWSMKSPTKPSDRVSSEDDNSISAAGENPRSMIGTGISHPGYRHDIVDKQTGKVVGVAYSNKRRAYTRVDKLDNEYGGYRYRVETRKARPGELTDKELSEDSSSDDVNISASEQGPSRKPVGYWKEGGEGLTQLKELANNRKTLDEMSTIFGNTKPFIYKILKNNNIKYDPDQTNQYLNVRKVDTDEIKNLRKAGLTWRQIGDELKVSSTAAYKQGQNLNIPTNEKISNTLSLIKGRDLTEFKKAVVEGKSQSELSDRFGVSINTVRNTAKKLDLDIASQKRGPRGQSQEMIDKILELNKLGKSFSQIARELKIGLGSVAGYIQRNK